LVRRARRFGFTMVDCKGEDRRSEPPRLLRTMSSDDGDHPSVGLKSLLLPQTASFRLPADWVCLCRGRRECGLPDSTPHNREQGASSVVRSAGSRGPATPVDNFLPSAPRCHWPKSSTTPHCDIADRIFKVTHPFHPLYGCTFELVIYRNNWGEDRVYFHNPEDG
jgi:hypothetical protein